jgi:signal transduction histidine kinase
VRRDFAFYKATYSDTAGRVAGLVGVMLDVSERKEAARAMSQRLAYETALADMSQALLEEESADALTKALRPVLASTNADHVLLWENVDDPDEGLVAVLKHEATAEGVRPWLGDPERSRLPYGGTFQRFRAPLERGEHLLIHADGLPEAERAAIERLGHRNLLVLPILSAGELLGVLSIEHGETAREWSEPDLRLLRTMAERIGAYLGRARAEEALGRAERLAALGTFAGGVAHEFNNLNAGILGFAELLYYDELLHADLRPKIERILHAARRAGDITKSLLEFASPGEGRRVPRNLNQVVRQALSVFDPVLEGEAVEVELKLGELPDAPIDPGEISQALLNLLLNAKHALIERPEKRIRIETARERGRLVVRIHDTGRGIPQAVLRRIFTPFYSTKGEHARSGSPENRLKGVGLGLSVAHSILRHHDGGIQVESVEEKGSTFTLWIPFRDSGATGIIRAGGESAAGAEVSAET